MRILSTIKLYHKWWKAWGSLPVHAWVAGASLYRTAQYNDAINHYRDGFIKYAHHPAALCAKLDLAYCYFKIGSFAEAETELKEIIERAPQMREAYLRLAQLQNWLGQSLEASWTMHKALRHLEADSELVGIFLNSLIDNNGPEYLLTEAVTLARRVEKHESIHSKLKVARARLLILQGEKVRGETDLENLAAEENASRDAVLTWAEQLMENGQIAQARYHLRRLMNVSADYPRVVSLLAQSYLKSGPFYNIEFAIQLATNACQRTAWSSPREMYILAEAFYHSGDKMASLLVASKAKDAGNKMLGSYPEAENLNALIENLSSGTLA